MNNDNTIHKIRFDFHRAYNKRDVHSSSNLNFHFFFFFLFSKKPFNSKKVSYSPSKQQKIERHKFWKTRVFRYTSKNNTNTIFILFRVFFVRRKKSFRFYLLFKAGLSLTNRKPKLEPNKEMVSIRRNSISYMWFLYKHALKFSTLSLSALSPQKGISP